MRYEIEKGPLYCCHVPHGENPVSVIVLKDHNLAADRFEFSVIAGGGMVSPGGGGHGSANDRHTEGICPPKTILATHWKTTSKALR
jgi:hypothetical protein